MTHNDPMTEWPDIDPRIPRTEGPEPWITYVGRTKVYSDRQGPYKFVRDGVEVPCVCDPEKGVTCQAHTRGSQALFGILGNYFLTRVDGSLRQCRGL